ncbi:MAG: hypothetical protein M3478_11035 [Planctomycetota bacterium]|nr:hypothetical protein [Planctomycetota bacterium]
MSRFFAAAAFAVILVGSVFATRAGAATQDAACDCCATPCTDAVCCARCC